MKRHFQFLMAVGLACGLSLSAVAKKPAKVATPEVRDLYSDTWVATDAIGRTMPSYDEVGAVKNDQRRVVGIFYITWHTQNAHNADGGPYLSDVTKILKQDPSARFDAKHPLWHGGGHYAEPEMGYFLSQDEWVVRKDISMLVDAGVDVLVMDVTNAVRYWEEWEVLFSTMEKMKAEGNQVPKFCFWAFNGPVLTVVQDLYNRIYKENKYPDLWFYWDDKPLLLYNSDATQNASGGWTENPNPNYTDAAVNDPKDPHYNDPDYTQKTLTDYTSEVKKFFTLRNMWWGYYKWGGKRYIGTEDNWSFGYSLATQEIKDMKPEELLSTHNGIREEAAVTPAQHPVTMTANPMGVGKSWTREFGEPQLDQYDMPEVGYIPYLKATKENPVLYGAYFQESWDYALKANPQFLYINDWNEWTAGKYHPDNGGKTPWLGRMSTYYFVDQYNMEFNRGIQPMKGGYTDNYYMQMAQNIRRYKGIRPIPQLSGYVPVKIDGKFADWKPATTEYRDTKGDTFHRDANGYANLHYVNTSGRNDIITSKVAVDKETIAFYAETAAALTPCTDPNWMMLLIDADNNSATGWNGYDFIVNKSVKDKKTTTLMRYESDSTGWVEVASVPMSYAGNQLEIAIPRAALGLTGGKFTFDFKWADNPADLNDPISLCLNGDTAPNRRFNYRCIWAE